MLLSIVILAINAYITLLQKQTTAHLSKISHNDSKQRAIHAIAAPSQAISNKASKF